jgi:GT2 family glycosyltransferase
VTTPVRPITIVVPVYGDLESLLACLASLKLTVDTRHHNVLLIDDHGPDSEEIVAAIHHHIDGVPGFRLERNSANLGFVGTCNRAAFELDTSGNDLLFLNSDTETTTGFLEELAAVLALSPLHGAVCPRSNNATIASLPFRLSDPSVGRAPKRTAEVHLALQSKLPRFTIAPVAMGFCILIRRELVERFGLFDNAFAPGYGEENDFCLRVAQHGFLSLLANRALVFHEGSRSFTGVRRSILRARHEQIITRRYPHYRDGVGIYQWARSDVADLFADVLVPSRSIPNVLLVMGAPDTDAVLASARLLVSTLAVKLTVATAHHIWPTHTSPRRGRVHDLSSVSGVFDLAIGSAQLNESALKVMDRSAPRWVLVSPQRDDDAIRTLTGLRFANHVVAPEQLRDSAVLLDLITQTIGENCDLVRLRERHAYFAPATATLSQLGPPTPSRAWRLRQFAVDRAPTVTVVTEWLVLAVLFRLRNALGRIRGR